jgi:probable F420-dependent oxidoreductase
MKIDVILQSFDDLMALPGIARSAEEMGFDGVWSTEVQHDPFIQLTLGATTTQRVTLGTAIALSFTRSPMSLAYTCWDLAAMTQGRFILGLGTQVKAHNERRFSVPWLAPIPRLREVVEGMRAIWQAWRSGERLNYRGEHYQFTLMTPFFTPPRHDYAIPIYIAGINTGLCKLAGWLCEGFHVHPLNSVKYLQEVIRPAISEGAEGNGRSIADVSLSGSVFVVTGVDDQQKDGLREMVRQQISFYASTPSYRIIFETHGWEDVAERLSRLAARKKWGEMPGLVTDEMIETFAVVAEPDQVGQAVIDRYAGLLDRVHYYLPYPGDFGPLWESSVEVFSASEE